MSKALVTYYSSSGNTGELGRAMADSLAAEGVEVVLKSVADTTVDELVDYDCIVAGSPTYYGTMAWQLKKLFDDSVRLHGRLEGKVGAAFTSSANLAGGNETALMDILKAMLIHGMIVVGASQGDHYGPVAIGRPDARAKAQCARLAANLARVLETMTP